MNINPERTVGALVAEQAGRSRVFELHGLDYCCGGKKSLAEACAEKRLNSQTIIEDLMLSDAALTETDRTDWTQASIIGLIENIVTTHHLYLRQELPRLTQLVGKVASVHGPNHTSLFSLKEIYDSLRIELEAHMKDEEEFVFPSFRLLASRADFGMLADNAAGLIDRMEREHEAVGTKLADINRVTGGYRLPPDGCETYRAMLHGLMTLEQDVHLHVHKENNILFPKALAAA